MISKQSYLQLGFVKFKFYNLTVAMLNEKLSPGLSGIAGEYFVAAELSRRGFMASITLRNNDSVDIHASKLSRDKVFAIQVKTTQVNGRKWTLSAKSEKFHSKNLFYIFVILKGQLERPEYFVVPSETVAAWVTQSHQTWLATLGKKGQAHNDSSMRHFEDRTGEFLERWDLLN